MPARNFRAWLFGIGWRKYREQKRGWLRLLEARKPLSPEMQETVTDPDPGLRLDLSCRRWPPCRRNSAPRCCLCLVQEFTHAEAAEALAYAAGYGKVACRAGPGKTGSHAWRVDG